MRARFLAQPFDDGEQTGEALAKALQEPGRQLFWSAVAWAKRSGLARIQADLVAFRAAGGHAAIVLGVDEGGATIEGLELAIKLFDEPYVFHDPGARTFHPKLYVVEGPSTATMIVGSGNATRGGLFTNFEASVVLDLDLSAQADSEMLVEVRKYFDRLLAETTYCRPLDRDLVDTLTADASIRVASEKLANAVRRSVGEKAATGTFGRKAMVGLKGAPAATEDLDDELDDDDVGPVGPPLPGGDLSASPSPSQPGPPPSATLASADVLVAEIPKNAPKRLQADVGREFFVSFFGGTPGAHAQVQIQPVDLAGNLGNVESRALIGTKSHNYRLELAAGRGTPYPAAGRPIGLFRRMNSGIIAYHVLWPADPAHTAVEALLTKRFGPAGRSMRRSLVTYLDLKSAWPGAPLP